VRGESGEKREEKRFNAEVRNRGAEDAESWEVRRGGGREKRREKI
jgi:hypothetical protein